MLRDKLLAGIHTVVADIDAGGGGDQEIDLIFISCAEGAMPELCASAAIIVVIVHLKVLSGN